MVLATTSAFGQGGGGGVSVDTKGSGGVSSGFLLSTHMFFYTDNSSLGNDKLNDGSSSYTRFDAQYNMSDYFSGFGFFYQQDKFGKGQTDTGMGLIVELVAGSFFVKFMPGSIQQQFVDRSFAKRAGSYLAYEAGIRGNFYDGLLFYEVALHRRTENITQEDGRAMSDKFTKTETMPMLGGGVTL